MRPVPTVVGVLLAAIGAVALIAGEVTQAAWWFVAAACALAGVLGIVSAVRGDPG